MRRSAALLAVLLALVGCARSAGSDPEVPKLRYPEVLSQQGAPPAAASKLIPPRGSCRARALARLGHSGNLLADPLPPDLRSGYRRVLEGLHPAARRVLARTHGVWLADHIDDAAAIYFPCEMDVKAARGGFILLDAGEYPLEAGLRDVHVPMLYWQAMAGPQAEGLPASGRPPVVRAGDRHDRGDPAVRYVVLHELGHALSLFAGEFELSDTGRFRVARTDGFVRFSWRLTPSAARRRAGERPLVATAGVAPRVSLSLAEWETVLDLLDADPALPSPAALLWVQPQSRARARRACRAASKLTRAGFVTPAAAVYPTEDYAETFAHAILAAEQRISRHDRFQLDLPHCGLRQIRSPYYSPWVTAKRRYLEVALGLQPAD